MKRKTEKDKRFDLALKSVEEKILIERLLLERINILVSQNDMLDRIHEKLLKEVENLNLKQIRKDIRTLAVNIKKLEKKKR